VREALEAYAVRQCEITSELIADLEASIERTVRYLKTNNKRLHIEEDASFHRRLAAAAGNNELNRMLETIQNQIWLIRSQTYRLSSGSAPNAHLRIVAALKKKDKVEAESAIREHISYVCNLLVKHLEEMS
jgi:DNA-binding GntR family transcriptional regulator